ncbi:GGDEF domain-containing protein [Solirubrobacter taibaiensis]|nr:GGDEF domain-containing protein [Solirubrobacter taibaiensis]
MIPLVSRRELVRRCAPFVAAAASAFALVPVGTDVRWDGYGLALLLTALVVGSAIVVPWERLPGSTRVLPVLLFLVAAACLRDAAGGTTAGIGIITLLPVVWCALYHPRSHLMLVLVGVLIFFALPPLLVGGDAYPLSGLRQGAVSAIVGAVIGLTVQRLVHRVRRDAAHSEAQRAELERLARESAALMTELERMARTDTLTGLANRRAWTDWLTAAASGPAPFAVAMLDLDHFKTYNDTHGHASGDALLAEAAAVWTPLLDGHGRIARIGGEEFAVLLSTPYPEAVIERLRRATPYGQTVSAGIAAWDGAQAADALMRRADDALYAAKRLGRDRYVVADEALAPSV